MSAYPQIQSNTPLSEQEYLATEQVAETKREYINGEVRAMAGAGYNHNCISTNLVREFSSQLKGTPCATFMADLKVKLGQDYVYPDVLVDCNPMHGDALFSTAPKLIVEVLSRSTRKTDTTTKLMRYINLPSLEEYVLVESDIVCVQALRRSQHWRPDFYFLGDSITFDSIGLTLPVEEIYDRVDNADMNEFKVSQTLP